MKDDETNLQENKSDLSNYEGQIVITECLGYQKPFLSKAKVTLDQLTKYKLLRFSKIRNFLAVILTLTFFFSNLSLTLDTGTDLIYMNKIYKPLKEKMMLALYYAYFFQITVCLLIPLISSICLVYYDEKPKGCLMFVWRVLINFVKCVLRLNNWSMLKTPVHFFTKLP